MHDYRNPINPKMPAWVEPGDKLSLYSEWEPESLVFRNRPTRFGIRDNFGRDHWVSRRNLRELQAEYDKAFPPVAV